MKTLKRTNTYPLNPDVVFQCLDSLGVTGMHICRLVLQVVFKTHAR